MNALLAVLIILAIALLLTGGLVKALAFLIWVGIVLAVISVVVALVRFIGGRNTTL
ncbi:MAG TPA: hypothetical protein VK139_01355 [Microbacteriaceae bacterium]|nr:hypothetical protein [Microbacteriaceae bacterium]